MPDFLKWLSGIASLPLWVLLSAAATAWIILLLPEIGPVRLDQLRSGHEAWVALVAIFTTVASIMCAASKASRHIFETRQRLLESRRRDAALKLERLYEPLHALVDELPMCIATAVAAPRFLDRLENAVLTAEEHRPSMWALRSTVKDLFDRRVIGPSGEMEYGARFPIEQIERLVAKHQAISDARLIELLRRAVRTRLDDPNIDEFTLSGQDCELMGHIANRWAALRKVTGADW